MVKVTFFGSDDHEYVVEASAGSSLMEAARQNGIPGIEADCGGACACGTCHIHIAAKWADNLAAPTESEQDMLEFVSDPQPNSRLSCQIVVNDEIDGIEVRIPPIQG